MAAARSLVRPSCRKNNRCPSPQRGAVRNSLPVANPCAIPSANPVPMLCTKRSEKRLALVLESASVTLDAVANEGVWQSAQPVEVNNDWPLFAELEDGP